MSDKITIEQLRKEQAYLNLTDPQRRLVEVFLETGNKLKAVQAAYKCGSEKSARVMTYTVFRLPNVIACLAAANGSDPEREKFNAELQRMIRNRKVTRNQISVMRLLAQTRGYLFTLPEPDAENESEPQKFAIGSIIVQDGKRYEVRAEEIS
jgi:Fe2+ or Zn2+ uptake regulation protein